MENAFEALEDRMAALRITPREVVDLADPPMSYPTYWRARSGTAKLQQTKTRIIRRIEEALDRLEARREKCSLCGKVMADLPARGCEEFGCPIPAHEKD